MVYEDKRSSLGHLGDNGLANGQISCLCVSGKARWCYNNVVLPSEWNENVKGVWERDYKESERVIELFKLQRVYKELMEILNRQGGDKINLPSNETEVTDDDNNDDIDDLPCNKIKVISTVVDDYRDNNKHLPVVRAVSYTHLACL